MRPRDGITWVIGFGPAVAWAVWVVARYGPGPLGYARALAVALVTAMGVLGLSALVLAYLPFLLERLGLARLAAFLRRYWDPDAL